ncbi:MAG: M18 family aminopeptidase, partial [Pseudohongiellaceae bacterium]
MSKHSDSDTRLISFLQASPTPYHAVANMGRKLQDAGFQRLDETCAWQLAPGQNYYVTRNDSSLIAFKTGSGDLVSKGVRLAGAHTDSPCLKIKPNPEILKNNYLQLGVEVYGGVLLNPWYDRDLSIAGRVNYI